jgi:hypothetical protein
VTHDSLLSIGGAGTLHVAAADTNKLAGLVYSTGGVYAGGAEYPYPVFFRRVSEMLSAQLWDADTFSPGNYATTAALGGYVPTNAARYLATLTNAAAFDAAGSAAAVSQAVVAIMAAMTNAEAGVRAAEDAALLASNTAAVIRLGVLEGFTNSAAQGAADVLARGHGDDDRDIDLPPEEDATFRGRRHEPASPQPVGGKNQEQHRHAHAADVGVDPHEGAEEFSDRYADEKAGGQEGGSVDGHGSGSALLRRPLGGTHGRIKPRC